MPLEAELENVCYRKLEGAWEATLKTDGKKVHLGYFESANVAKRHREAVVGRVSRERVLEKPWAGSFLIPVGRNGRPRPAPETPSSTSLLSYPRLQSSWPVVQDEYGSSSSESGAGVSASMASPSLFASISSVDSRVARLEAGRINTQALIPRRKPLPPLKPNEFKPPGSHL